MWRELLRSSSLSLILTLGACNAGLSQSIAEDHAIGQPEPQIEFVGLELKAEEKGDTLHTSPECEFNLPAGTLELLRSAGIVGRLNCGSSGRLRTFKARGKVVVLMNRQLEAPVELLLPVEYIVYVQTENGWQSYPSDARTTAETLRLYPDPDCPGWATLYSVKARGGTTGGTLFTWGTINETVN